MVDLQSGSVPRTLGPLALDKSMVLSRVAVSPSGEWAAVADEAGFAWWNAEASTLGDVNVTVIGETPIMLQIGDDGAARAVGRSGTIYASDGTVQPGPVTHAPITAATIDSLGRILMVESGDTILRESDAGWVEVAHLDPGILPVELRPSESGRYLAIIGQRQTSVVDVTDGSTVAVLAETDNTSIVTDVVFSEDERDIVAIRSTGSLERISFVVDDLFAAVCGSLPRSPSDQEMSSFGFDPPSSCAVTDE